MEGILAGTFWGPQLGVSEASVFPTPDKRWRLVATTCATNPACLAAQRPFHFNPNRFEGELRFRCWLGHLFWAAGTPGGT